MSGDSGHAPPGIQVCCALVLGHKLQSIDIVSKLIELAHRPSRAAECCAPRSPAAVAEDRPAGNERRLCAGLILGLLFF
jgi:hypothetical protein